MGTRLYPNTNDSSILEILAGVSQGTMERLTKMQENHKELLTSARERGEDTMELEHELWKEIHNDPNMGALDNFTTFGWGKLRGAVYEVLESNPDKWEGETYGGSTNDSSLCAQMLVAQGVDVVPFITNNVSTKDLCGMSWG
jgi:hypothetical protein